MLRGGVEGIRRSWQNRSRRSYHWNVSNVSRLCCPDLGGDSKEGKAELKTVQEPSIMRTENYPSGPMEVSGKLNKGVQLS